jgi:hypothetical protein
MKLYLHVGMTKAGSTSIQNAFSEHREIILGKYGILYPEPGTSFQNHHELYQLIWNGDPEPVKAYLEGACALARSAKAQRLLLSSEDMFLLPNTPAKMLCLAEVLRALEGVEARIVFVVRHPRTWMRSHIAQLLSNGAFALDEYSDRYTELPQNIVECIKAFLAMDQRMLLMSYRRSTANGTLVRDFFGLLDIALEEDWERNDNVTGKDRFYSMEAQIGLLCGLRALNYKSHPNSKSTDALRSSIRELVDSMSKNPSVARLLNPLEAILRHELNILIDNSISKLSLADHEFLRGLDPDDGVLPFPNIECE